MSGSEAGPNNLVQAFAEEMTRVWRAHGKPNPVQMETTARKEGMTGGKTAFRDVMIGSFLSKWTTVESFLRVLGEDPKQWQAQWEAADDQSRTAKTAGSGGLEPPANKPAPAVTAPPANEVVADAHNTDADRPPAVGRGSRMLWAAVAVAVLSSVLSVLVTLAVAGDRGGQPDAPGRVVEVQNQIAIGDDGLIEDPNGPAYLSTKPQPKCSQHNCKIDGTDMQTGALLVVVCQIPNGASMVNYNTQVNDAQNNSHKAQSARWYQGRFPDGRTGYLSEIFIAPKHRGGLGLPTCSQPFDTSALGANGPRNASGTVGAGGDSSGAARPLTKDDVDATCTIVPTPARGVQVTLTYTITAKTGGRLDLGAEIYSDDATELADGFGDLHSYLIKAGPQKISRPLKIPGTLKPGNYEIVGELWPDGKIGTGDTVVGPTCTTFSIP
jgi:hypothetical protein